MKSKNPGFGAVSPIPRRGEIWWVALDPVLGSEIAKTRPCVVLSRDTVNELRRTVVVVPLSSSPLPHPPIHVAVRCAGKPAVAVVDQIRAISKQRLSRRVGVLSEEEIESITDALQQILDLR
jgi:mRNA interferase MazF